MQNFNFFGKKGSGTADLGQKTGARTFFGKIPQKNYNSGVLVANKRPRPGRTAIACGSLRESQAFLGPSGRKCQSRYARGKSLGSAAATFRDQRRSFALRGDWLRRCLSPSLRKANFRLKNSPFPVMSHQPGNPLHLCDSGDDF